MPEHTVRKVRKLAQSRAVLANDKEGLLFPWRRITKDDPFAVRRGIWRYGEPRPLRDWQRVADRHFPRGIEADSEDVRAKRPLDIRHVTACARKTNEGSVR